MDDIFREVDDEVRAERARHALRRYGGLVVLAAVLALGGATGWLLWARHERLQNEAAATLYVSAMRLGESTVAGGEAPARNEAMTAFEKVVDQAPEGYRTLARMRLAALQEDGGAQAAALGGWQAVADDPAADPLLRGLANLYWVYGQIETGDPVVLKARLDSLTPANNPWHGLALEALALLDMRQGHTEMARQTLHNLTQDTTAPEGVRGRATSLLARLEGG